MKYLSKDGLIYLWNLIKTRLGEKVDKVEGKGLSTNDLTNELKSKYDSAQPNTIEEIKINNIKVDPVSKVVNISVITRDEVGSMISTEVGKISNVTLQKVAELPTTGKENIIYLVPVQGDANNAHIEYIWVDNAWEIIGSTKIDLTNYVQFSDLEAITNSEIDAVIAM